MTTTETLTDTMIRALRDEALAYGDAEQVEICELALVFGDHAARGACATAITDARAMRNDEDEYELVIVVP